MSGKPSAGRIEALRLIKEEGLLPYQAAARAGIGLSTMYRVLDQQSPALIAARMLNAETRCKDWLAKGNAALAKGAEMTARRCFYKSEIWLERYNEEKAKAKAAASKPTN